MGMKRRKYSREFKIEAVRMFEESDKTASEISRQLGISRNLLYRWRKQLIAEGDEAFPGLGQPRSGDEELHRLRRENARLREERDILKKAVAFFSRESK